MEVALMLVSLVLLLSTCVQSPTFHALAVLAWLISFAILALWNQGAALGVYIAALALYSNLFFRGNFSLFERPDHPALLILVSVLVFFKDRGPRPIWRDAPTLIIASFLGYGVINGVLTGTYTQGNLAGFARGFGIPLFLAVLLARSRPDEKILWTFYLSVILVATYSALVSLLWQLGFTDWIFPSWINDPSVNRWHGGARAGGILMQPAWNGLFLGLVFCMTVIAYRRWILGHGRLLLLGAGVLILFGIYATYTRAVYLGTLVAVSGFLWSRPFGGRHTVMKRVGLAVGTSAAVVLLVLTPPARLEDRIENTNTIHWRIDVWKAGLEIVPRSPVFGFGFRGFEDNVASFYNDRYLGAPAAHNTLLAILVQFGLVGLSLYGLVLFQLFRGAAAGCKSIYGGYGRVWLLIFIGVYYVQAQFAVTLEPTTNAVFFCTLGMLVGMARFTATHRGSVMSGPQEPAVYHRHRPSGRTY